MRPETLSQKMYKILSRPHQHYRLIRLEKRLRRLYEEQAAFEREYIDQAKMDALWQEPYEYCEGTLEYYSDRFRSYHRMVYILRTIEHFKGVAK